jgi:putative inorganic carbon (hco3(-)) transporter
VSAVAASTTTSRFQPIGAEQSARSTASELRRLAVVVLPGALLAAYALVPEPPYGARPFDDAWHRHLIAGIAVSLWVIALIVARRLPRQVPLLGPLLLLLTVEAISAAVAPNWRIGVEPVLNLAAGIVIFAALVDCPGLSSGSLRWSLMLTALALSAACIAFVLGRFLDWRALVQAIPDARVGLLPPTVPRDLGTGTNPNIIAPLIAFAAPLYLLSVVESRGPRRLLLIGMACVIQIGIFFTLSRAAWFGEIAGLALTVALLLLSAKRVSRRWIMGGATLAGGALAVAVIGAVALLSTNWRPQWLFRPTVDDRADFRVAAVSMIRRHPVLGSGPGGFILNYPYVSDGDPVGAVHSHNVLLEIAVESGLLGVLAAALVAFTAGRILWRLWRRGSLQDRRLVAGASGGLAVFLVGGSADALQLFPEILFGLGMLMAIAIRAQTEASTGDSKDMTPSAGSMGIVLGLVPLMLAAFLFLSWLAIDRAERHYDRSITLASQQRWLESAVEAESAADLDPAQPAYLVQQALTLEMAYENHLSPDGRDRAVFLLRKALDMEPRSALTQLDLAALLDSNQQHDAALAEAPVMVAGAPRDSLVLLAAGVLEEPQQPDLAVGDYAAAMAQSPRIADSDFWHATAFRRDHYAEIVRAALNRASTEDSSGGPGAVQQIIANASGLPLQQLSNGTSVGQIDQARSDIRNGNVDAAAVILNRAERKRPDDPAVRLARGELYQRRGDLAGARGEWLVGAYLGDVESIMNLGDTSPGGRVPGKVIELGQWGLNDLWDRQFSLAVQHYRFAYRRQEPLPIVLAGDWLNAMPPLYQRLRAAVDRWQNESAATSGSGALRGYASADAKTFPNSAAGTGAQSRNP